jgi:pimeloyl-ACP methyl ester carboxylesterase
MAASVSSRVLRVRRMVAIALLVATAWSTVTPLVSSARAQTAPAAAGDAVRPFSIRVPEATLVDLKARLAKARLPEPLAGPGWNLGTDVVYLRQLLDYWRDRFDWRAQERLLNRMEQFTTTIDGLSIHFVHRRSPHAGALPLLVTHGWPGSIAEFTKVIGPLTDPPAHGGRADDAFHVVMPSIPGFGFSTAPRAAGMDPARIAAIEAALMARLGYTRYGVQGGDWGAIIGTQVAARHPAQVAGLHLNMCSAPAPAADPNAGLTDAELARLKVRQVFQAEETGYQQIQGTKPQTIGIALTDSPVGLAAWIVEKFRTWCDCEGNPEAVFTKDELLTNITLYWTTQSAASSARIYYESRHPTSAPVPGRIEVPTACADFPKEIIWSPRRWAEARYNITRWTMMPKGGHFAALEQPHALVDDVRAFFRDLRPR